MNINYDTCTKEELIEAHKELADSHQEQAWKIEQLTRKLNELERMIFGRKSERFEGSEPAEQLKISFSQEEETAAPPSPQKEQISYTRTKASKKQHPVRQALPAHLPRTIIDLYPEGYDPSMKTVGQPEITEVLEYNPGKLHVIRYQRHKIKTTDVQGNEQIQTAALPGRVIDKGIAGTGLLSNVITDKYLDHLPLYRQSERFAREDVELSRSTLSGWVGQCSNILQPLYEVLKKEVLTSPYLQVDESGIKVMTQDKEDSMIKGCMQIYHAVHEKLSFYLYTQTKEKENLLANLRSYKGNLQVDGNVSYEEIKKAYTQITVSHCMAHARRHFEKALDNDRDRASHVLTEMQRLYAIERHAREEELDINATMELRKRDAIPILDELKKWLDREYDQVLPKSLIGKAIAYTLARWQGLYEYALTGTLQIDNNLVENIIRPLALGRKNYLFAGSHDGARRAATFYSFFATCKLNDVNPYRWLRDVLIRIQDHPVNRLKDLLPLKTYVYLQSEEEA